MATAADSRRGATAPVPLLDVSRGNARQRDEILDAITRVVDAGCFLHGPDVRLLEQEVARVCQASHAVSCASGSDALLLSLMALGVGPGDEVIVPSFTFFATASAAWRLGARPVFVDIDPRTYNVDPDRLEAAITPRTKAIIPVHLFGQCCEIDVICELAHRHGLAVIEDVAQAIGAKFQGRPAGAWGLVGCLSFYPTKNLGGFGDGGMLTTSDAALAERLRLFASHGMNPRYYHSVVGINSRLDTIQAAVLRVKMTRLAEMTAARRANATRYHEWLTAARLDRHVLLPESHPDGFHVWNQYTLRVPGGRRDALRQHLSGLGIGSEIYYPVPLHQQACFRGLGYGEGSLPATEQAAREVLSLPIFPELAESEQRRVVDGLAGFFAAQTARAA